MSEVKHEVLLQAKGIYKNFETSKKDQAVHALTNVDLTLYRGETLALVGESGCGKSTLGRTLIRMLPATRGSVTFEGQNITAMKDKEFAPLRRRMQMVFQDPYSSLDPRMTVEDIIGEPLDVHKLYTNRKERREKILDLMATVGLNAEHATRYAHEFSGGQRQRIGIARALAVNPKFIVCDEPVSALDVSIQAQVINMFAELQEKFGLTYLFIAHDLLVVRHISDRIAVMYLGKMVELANANEIYDHPLHPYSKSLLSAVPVPDPKIARANQRIVLSGDIPSPLNAPSGCPFRTRCPYACDKCAESMPDFQEVSAGHFVACHRVGEIN